MLTWTRPALGRAGACLSPEPHCPPDAPLRSCHVPLGCYHESGALGLLRLRLSSRIIGCKAGPLCALATRGVRA
eukprot:434351-Rhodomonas_salina.1